MLENREIQRLGTRIQRLASANNLVAKGYISPFMDFLLRKHPDGLDDDEALVALASEHMPTIIDPVLHSAVERVRKMVSYTIAPVKLVVFPKGPGRLPGWTIRAEAEGGGGGPTRTLSAYLPAEGIDRAIVADEAEAVAMLLADVEAAKTEFSKARSLWKGWTSKTIERLVADAGLTPEEARTALKDQLERLHGSTPPVRAVLRFIAADIDLMEISLKQEHVSLAAVRSIQGSSGYDDYPANFPLARSMKRHHILIVGPTNSGKTHDALSIAAKAPTATVLSPLRLLAAEHQDALAARGVVAGMVTGEEVDMPDGTTHVAQTVETLDTSHSVDVCVIDEIQMLAQRERGWAWTRAVVGAPAPLVVMTGSEDIVPSVRRLVELCGDTLEIHRVSRLSPLEALTSTVSVDEIGKGDALIAFSRSEVLRWKARLEMEGLRVAAVYGALSPAVRRREAERFRSQEADVLVATDAIGFGLNLGPLRRIVLTETSKYDGRTERPLRHAEILQITGRAGRYGHQSLGQAGVLDGLDPRDVIDALKNPLPELELETFVVSPDPKSVASAAELLGSRSLGEILRFLRSHLVYGSSDFSVCDLDRTIVKADLVDRFDFSMEDKLQFALSPIDKTRREMENLLAWAAAHAAGVAVVPEGAPPGADLAALEASDSDLSTYMWMARRLPLTFSHAEVAATLRDEAAERIAEVLAAEVGTSPSP